MQHFRPLEIRDCAGALWAFYRRYEGVGLASFEGDLSELALDEFPGASGLETSALRRQTLDPKLDFIVIPLTSENIVLLKKRLSRPGTLGRDGAIVHTQLEVDGEAVLIACDNFHDECTVVASSVPEEFLIDLRSHGVLREFGGLQQGS